jgi:hypothetical protein
MVQLIIGIVAGMGAGFVLGQRAARRSVPVAVPPPPTPPPTPAVPDLAAAVEPGPAVPTPTSVPATPPPSSPPSPPPPVPAADALPPPTNQPANAKPRRPNKRAAKLGLTEDDFKPADDILERMQKAWELGVPLEDLDAALAARAGTPAPAAATTGPAVGVEGDERLRRVLERLDGGGAEDDTGGVDADVPDDSEAAATASTVTEAVAQLDAAGYHDRLELGDGELHCDVCGAVHSPDVIVVDRVLRFEGPSDPADEAIVLALRCPECDARSTLVSAFGPDADPRLADAFVYLASRARHR